MNYLGIVGIIWVLFLVMGSGGAVCAQESEQRVLVHYMPWYASKDVSGQWGWHWTMNHFDSDQSGADGQRHIASHQYPLIDVYDSSDSVFLECHTLLMKMAGIDGVIIDWYGVEPYRDYGEIHRNTQKLMECVRKAELEFAICYEDQTIKHLIEGGKMAEQAAELHGREVFRWLDQHAFSDPAYVRLGQNPILLVFGPQYFNARQWEAILEGMRRRPVLYGLPHLAKTHGMDGAFGWPPVSGGRDVTPGVWRDYLDSLYRETDLNQPPLAIAFPGFHDIYEEAGLHKTYGSIDAKGGRTFRETFDRALRSGAPIVQIATWNDYGEGTVIEPTRDLGYQYLEYIQTVHPPDLPYTAADLRLAVLWYQLKKRAGDDEGRVRELQRIRDLLYRGECEEARRRLQALSAKLDGPVD